MTSNLSTAPQSAARRDAFLATYEAKRAAYALTHPPVNQWAIIRAALDGADFAEPWQRATAHLLIEAALMAAPQCNRKLGLSHCDGCMYLSTETVHRMASNIIAACKRDIAAGVFGRVVPETA